MQLTNVQSTRGRFLDLADFRGKALVVFYETRDCVDDNAELKQACGELQQSGGLGGRLEVLGVADVEGLRFVKRVVELAVRQVAARHGAELWLDFDGALRDALDIGWARSSAIAVVDGEGAVRFRAEGPLGARELERFFDALGAALDHGAASAIAHRLGAARGV